MKIRNLLFAIIFLTAFHIGANAQGVGDHVTMFLDSCVQIDSSQLRFDLMIVSDGVSTSDLRMNAVSYGVNFNTAILQSGATMTPSYLSGTTDSIFPDPALAILPYISPNSHIRITQSPCSQCNDSALHGMAFGRRYRAGRILMSSSKSWVANSIPNFSLQDTSSPGHINTLAVLYIDTAASVSLFNVTGTGDGFRIASDSCSLVLNITCNLSATISPTATTCYGSNDGVATAIAIGAVRPYRYLWNTSSTDSFITGLAPGTYMVTVTDVNNCTTTASATVSQPLMPTFNCYITNDEEITDSIYQFDLYLLNTSTLSFEFAAGQWGITVDTTVRNGGTLSASMIAGSSQLTNPSNQSPTTVSLGPPLGPGFVFNIDSVLHPGVGQGNIISNVDSNACVVPGTRVGTFQIINTVPFVNNGRMNHMFSFTSATGDTATKIYAYLCGHTIDITALGKFYNYNDSGTCLQNVKLNPHNCTTFTSATSTDVSCMGGNDGTASATTVGGVAPYSYLWINGETTNPATGLTAGNYSVLVTDHVGCTSGTFVTVNQPSIALTTEYGGDSLVCLGGTINLTSSASGGVCCYTYLWSGPNGFSSTSANNTIISATAANSGTYTIVITDAHNCVHTNTLPVLVAIPDTTTHLSSMGDTLISNCVGCTYQWFNCDSGTMITGATNQMYKVDTTGNFKVVVNLYGCIDSSACKYVLSVGDLNGVNNQFALYPNPTSGKFIFEVASNHAATVSLKILDVTGRVIYQEERMTKGKSEIDLSGTPAGVYMLLLNEGAGTYSQKLIIE